MIMRIIKIAVSILVGAFGFYMFLHDGRSIHKKDLNKKEKQYLDFIEIWFHASLFIIIGLIMGAFSE